MNSIPEFEYYSCYKFLYLKVAFFYLIYLVAVIAMNYFFFLLFFSFFFTAWRVRNVAFYHSPVTYILLRFPAFGFF